MADSTEFQLKLLLDNQAFQAIEAKLEKLERLNIDIDLKGSKRQLNDLTKTSKKTGVSAGQDFSRGFSRQLSVIDIALGNALASGFTALVGGIASFGRSSIDASIQFEQGMSRVKALTGATGEEFVKLENQAKQLGASTVFSATESAEAQAFLAQAGFETGEILSALPDVLALASAGELDLGRAADIASNVLGQYNLTAAETARVTNVLAAAASSSNTNVDQFAEAIKFLGPNAQALNISLEETAAIIGTLADSGIQGSLAGRALGTSLTRLTNPTKKMQGVMDELGVAFFDAKGEFIGVEETLRVLDDSFEGLTSQQKAAAITTLFGAEAFQEISILLNRGPEEYAKYRDSITGTNAAQEQAATKTDNLAGSLKAFGSAVESLQIAIGQAGLLDFLRAIVDPATKAIRALSDFVTLSSNASAILSEDSFFYTEKGERFLAIIESIKANFASIKIPVAAFSTLLATFLGFKFLGLGTLFAPLLGFGPIASGVGILQIALSGLFNPLTALPAAFRAGRNAGGLFAQGLLGGFKLVGTGLGGLLSAFRALPGLILPALSGVLGVLKIVFNPVLFAKIIGTAFSGIGSIIASVGTSFLFFLRAALNPVAIGKVLLGVFTKGIPFLIQGIPFLLSGIGAVFSASLSGIIPLVAGVFASLGAFILPLIGTIVAVGAAFGLLVAFFKRASDGTFSFQVVMEKLSNAFAYFQENILPVVIAKLQEFASYWQANIQPLFDAVVDKIINGVGVAFAYLTDTAVPYLIEKLGEFSEFWKTTLAPIFSGLAETILVGLSGAFTFFTDTLLPNLVLGFQGLAEVFNTFILPALQFFGGIIVDYIFPALLSLWNTIQTQLLPALLGLWEVIQPTLLPILKVLGTVLGVVLFVAIGILIAAFYLTIKAVEAAIAIFSIVTQVIGIVIDAVSRMARAFLDQVKRIWDFVTTAFSAVRNIFSGFIDFIIGVFTGDVGRAMQGVGKVIEGLKDYINLYRIGKDIMNGLINGIRDSISFVTSAVGDVASSMSNSFKSFFGINSPSRLFRGFGINLLEGLDDGVRKQAVQVAKTIEKVSADLFGEFETSATLNVDPSRTIPTAGVAQNRVANYDNRRTTNIQNYGSTSRFSPFNPVFA